MIEELIARVFASRNAAHLAHWKTKSFSQHMALNEFYDDVLDAIDKLVEAHQGAFDLIGDVELAPAKVKDIIAHLEEDMVWINENRGKVTNKLPALDNILQELEGVYLKALYKLRNLK
jgi:hypothetical protein